MIEDYAQALVHYQVCNTIEEARIESKRWHTKKFDGLEEPLKCPHRIGAEMEYVYGVRKEIILVHIVPVGTHNPIQKIREMMAQYNSVTERKTNVMEQVKVTNLYMIVRDNVGDIKCIYPQELRDNEELKKLVEELKEEKKKIIKI